MILANTTTGTGSTASPLVLLHGLTFDRRHWEPFRSAFAALDPARTVVSVDLPGHGASPTWDAYPLDRVADAVHATLVAAGMSAPAAPPFIVGHSIGGVIATLFAARHPAAGVVNIDQPLLAGPFGERLRRLEPVLRGPDFLDVWHAQLDGMRLDELTPEDRAIVGAQGDPTADILLGYWNELLTQPNDELIARRQTDLAAIQERNIPYLFVSSAEPPAPYLAWLRDKLPELQLAVLSGAGHFPHIGRAADLAAIVDEFTRSATPRTRSVRQR